MKRGIHLVTFAAGLAIAVAGAFAINTRTAEAAANRPTFARPNYEIARQGAILDLTRYSALNDMKRLAGISSNDQACHDALSAAGVRYSELPAVHATGGCGYDEAVVVQSSLSRWKAPDIMPMTCGLAAKLHLWERHIVIPAAEKYFGSPVVEIKAFGSFQCRRVAGYDRLSEHAFARAADISGFRLADGREVNVLSDFHDRGAKGDFLREVHDRACDLFDVTLGPDYNADHANHFHLDVGGERACR